MQIDWLTVGAQVVNFLLLVYLLQRLLYRPVMEAISNREKGIAERLRQAADREQAAQQKADEYEARIENIEAHREELMGEAENHADARRRALLARARAEVEQLEARWRRDLQREQGEFLAELRREIATAVQAVARRALAELADAELEQQILGKLFGQLDRLDDATRKALAKADDGITVRTTFALDGAQRSATTRRLHEQFGRELAVHYELDDSLACGIALDAGGRRLGWSVGDYLEDVEARLRDRLEAFDDEPLPREHGR